jgi:hypothetical protein
VHNGNILFGSIFVVKDINHDKFPLTLHKTGQFCKKIKGKIYYFGTNKKTALERDLEQAVYLHAGKGNKPKSTRLNNNFSLILREQ